MKPDNDVDHPIHDLLRTRWSPRAFDPDRLVDIDTLRSLLEAARWTPSAFNEQPWRFLVAMKQHPDEFQRVLGCLNEKNQLWARHAPVLLVAFAVNVYTHNGKPNRYALYDTGAAVAHLTLEATARGLHLHQMAGFDLDRTREAFNVPPTADPAAAVALGYVGDPATLPDPLRQREFAPGTRRPIEDFAFSGTWGRTMDEE